MPLFNLHTHIQSHSSDRIIEIFNAGNELPLPDGYFSLGIHPWFLSQSNFYDQLDFILNNINNPLLKAIGECGLDKLCPAEHDLQMKAFREMISISENNNKPLIIHCVKSFDEIIKLRKATKPVQQWIIHGFRGKPQLAQQLIRSGLMLSFGEKFNPESVAECPIDKLYIETDESNIPISELYNSIAAIKHIDPTELSKSINNRASRIFSIDFI